MPTPRPPVEGIVATNASEPPSKSQRKRDMTALQELGAALVDMPREALARVPLDEPLRVAIEEAQGITSHEGRRRQLQYIGKLMRSADVAPIRAELDALEGTSRAQAQALHRLERWRERLLEDDAALTRLAEEHGIDPSTLTELRTTIRMARRERDTARPPRHYRELFQKLKRILDEPL